MEAQMTGMVGRVLDDRYELVAPIGAGSTTMVFLAHDHTLDREVALKLAHPELAEDELFVERFRLRAQHAAELTHPNLVDVLDWGLEDGPYLVVELCQGGSLAALLAAGNRLTPSQALVSGLEAARALEYLHNQGVIHGSLTPSKMLFGSDQRLRISGTAYPNPSGAAIDIDSEVYAYWSPEQRNDLPVTDRADLYSLAMLLNASVSGHTPSALAADRETIDYSLGELRGILERSTRVEPTSRPDAGEMAISLLATAETMPRPGALPLVGLSAVDASVGDEVDFEPDYAPVTTSPDEYELVTDAAESVPGAVAHQPVAATVPRAAATAGLLDVPAAGVAGRSAEPRMGAIEDLSGDQRWWPVALLAAIVIASIGLGGWFWLQSEQASTNVVPELVGVGFADLDNHVRDFGWEIRKLENRRDGTLPGQIIEQDPPAGTELSEGDELRVTVSLGNQLVEIPSDLSGLSVEQAEGRLASVGLRLGDVSQENNEVLEAGLVVGISEPITQKPSGEPVALRVSVGPQTRVVPDGLVGLNVAAATEALAAIRLGVVQEEVFDPQAPVGTVLTVSPQAGAPIEADSNVTLGVSAGPAPVPVPDVTGLSLSEAIDIVNAVGLIFIEPQGTPGEPVIGTLPPIGEIVDIGTEVIIVLADPVDEDEEASEEDAEG